MAETPIGYRQGYNLILGLVDQNSLNRMHPLGYSTGCKISDSAETGERITKEPGGGNARWKEKYVKTLSEQITADGFVYDNATAITNNLPRLKELFLNAQPVMLQYQYRQANPEAQGATEVQYTTFRGQFIITSLEQDGTADDDEKWSITFENCGPVRPSEPMREVWQSESNGTKTSIRAPKTEG